MGTPILLHACCGPCSLAPVGILKAAGYEITAAYINPNIQPCDEYDRRLATLRGWAAIDGVAVVEGPCDRDAWERDVAVWGTNRPARCAACYRMRLEATARLAVANGFGCISTTLAVSPYQLFEVCGRELERAAGRHGLDFVWDDFRPHYAQATRRAKELGMYRQNYCGCRFSAAEAAIERAAARDARALDRDVSRAEGRALPCA